MSRAAHPAFLRIERAGAVPAEVTSALTRLESRALRATRDLDALALLGDCGLGGLLAELSLAAALDRESAPPRRVEVEAGERPRPAAVRPDAPALPPQVLSTAAAVPAEPARSRPSRAETDQVPREPWRVSAPAPAAHAGTPAIVTGEGGAGRNRLRAVAERAGAAGAADRRVARESLARESLRSTKLPERAATAGPELQVQPDLESLASSPSSARRPAVHSSMLLEGVGARLGRAADRVLGAAESSERRMGLVPAKPARPPASEGRWLMPESQSSGLRRLAAWASTDVPARPALGEAGDDPPLPDAAVERLEEDTLGARVARLLRREAIREGVELNGVPL